MLKLTEDIINISKLESGRFKLNYEKIDLKHLVIDVVNSVHVLLNEKDIDITLDICSGTFYLDRKLLTQVLYNLIDNAIKFTQAKWQY